MQATQTPAYNTSVDEEEVQSASQDDAGWQ